MYALKSYFKCITYVMLNLRDVSLFQNISEAHSHRRQMLLFFFFFFPGVAWLALFKYIRTVARVR